MSAPNEQQRVDVLAVMDALIEHRGAATTKPIRAPRDTQYRAAISKLREAEQARAAVAELIDKASALRSAHEAFQAWKKSATKDASVPRSILEMNVHAKAMLFAALANVGAAK